MSDNVKYCELPLSPTTIEEFYSHLQTEYILHGSDRMKLFTVLEIRHYKEQGLPEHEYISVKVHGPNIESYLCFERLRSKHKTDHVGQVPIKKTPTSASESSTSLSSSPLSLPRTPSQMGVDKSSKPKRKLRSPSPSSTIDSLNSLVEQRDACDRVTQLSTWARESTDQVHHTLMFRDAYPLYKLVVLAHTIHETRRIYLPFSDNCYFYAATIFKALQEVYNHAVNVKTTGLNNNKKSNSKYKPTGSWGGIDIYRDGRLDIQPLIKRFQEEKEIFKRQVQEYEDKQRAMEEGKRAAEESKRVAEEREAREIEARRAAEEGRRAAEAEIARLKFRLEQMAKQQVYDKS